MSGIAKQLPGFRGLSLITVIRKSVRNFFADDMPTYAAAIAYHVFFSLFPFVFFLIALLSFFDMSYFFDVLRRQAQLVFSDRAIELLNLAIDELRMPKRGLLSFGAVIALWLASGGVRSLMNALNAANKVEERRPFWKKYPLSILYTVGIAVILVLAAALLSVGPAGMQWLASYVGFEQLIVTLWTWLRWPAALLLLIMGVAAVYYAAPDIEQRFRIISPGSVLSVAVWIAASMAFGYYIRNFAHFGAMFGSVGVVIVLLLYLYLSAGVLLLGAEINAVVAREPIGKKPQVGRP